jgi:uncharacterized protein YdaU (DUF1376 family)
MMLGAEQKGVLITLLNVMYDRRKAIKCEAKELARMSGCSTRRFKQILAQLIDRGQIVEKDGNLTNPRFERELKREIDEREKRFKSGKTDAQKIIQNLADAKNINHLFENRTASAERSPETRNQNHIKKDSDQRDWSARPAHVGPNPEPPPHPALMTSSSGTDACDVKAGSKGWRSN